MSWIVGVGLGSFGAGAADVLGAVVPAPDEHPASATESATAIQPFFNTATVYREITVTAVLAVTTGPSSSRSAPRLLGSPPLRPGHDLAPVLQTALTLAPDRSGEARLVGDLVGALLAHAEEFGDLDDANGARLRRHDWRQEWRQTRSASESERRSRR
jgi:hypothetical protein